MKRLLPSILLSTFLIVAGGLGWYWWNTGRFIVTTNNAYIRSNITPISAKISGYVEKVLVSDNQIVAQGEPLVHIQDLEFRVRMERGINVLKQRQADLLMAEEKRKQQHSKIDLALARLDATEIDLGRATEELKRAESLHESKVFSTHKYSEALAWMKKCRAEKNAALATLKMAEQELAILLAEAKRIEAEIGQHRQELKLLQQDVADTTIYAPVSGTVGNRRVRTGQYVRPGSILMALIPLNDVWIEANFKEVQLARMKEGQPVDITVDAFSDLDFTGHIQSLSPASGAEFSILPPENATGNFTKIVQRIPVKIRFDKDTSKEKKLLPGMSVEIRLDTRMPAHHYPVAGINTETD